MSKDGIRTLGWVRMNSPSAVSSVYPFTPLPVESTRLQEDPYLNKFRIETLSIRLYYKTYIVYPAATISLPGRSTSDISPFSDC